MVVITMVNGSKTILMVKDNMFGAMVGDIKDLGKKIKCMVSGFIHGRTAENMKDFIIMIKNKDLANIIGLMEDHLKDNGKMEKDVA